MLPRSPVIPLGPAPLSAQILAFRRDEARKAGRTSQHELSRVPAWMEVGGFVDIHFHVAPGLDDGPANLDEAAALAWAAYRAGTLAVIATPHRSLRYDWSGQARADVLQGLHARLPEGFALFAGCELELSDEAWLSFEADPRRYCLNQSRYVLVELPRAGSALCFNAVLKKLVARGFVPILAHAERCRLPGNLTNRLFEWVRQGCLVQVTADAICGRRGRPALAAAGELLRAGLVHFVASDAHNVAHRGPNLQPAYRVVSEIAGVEQAARLFTYNPLRVLQDEPISA
jgi:protein-tyrosine phosphatase